VGGIGELELAVELDVAWCFDDEHADRTRATVSSAAAIEGRMVSIP
jgi:hypothetical protein